MQIWYHDRGRLCLLIGAAAPWKQLLLDAPACASPAMPVILINAYFAGDEHKSINNLTA